MSTLRASFFGDPAVTSLNTACTQEPSLPWDALVNNVNNDFEIAHTIVDSILTAPERCQMTPFYIQAVIANSSIFLVSNTGSSKSLKLTDAGACWLLGKSLACALPVEDSTVAPCHAVIRHMPESGFFIADVGSHSGTYLNRRRLHPQKRKLLRDGDMIELGNLMVEFFVDNFDHLDEPIQPTESHEITYTGYEVSYSGV